MEGSTHSVIKILEEYFLQSWSLFIGVKVAPAPHGSRPCKEALVVQFTPKVLNMPKTANRRPSPKPILGRRPYSRNSS